MYPGSLVYIYGPKNHKKNIFDMIPIGMADLQRPKNTKKKFYIDPRSKTDIQGSKISQKTIFDNNPEL